jgi:putative heme-binding domain-containing protein
MMPRKTLSFALLACLTSLSFQNALPQDPPASSSEADHSRQVGAGRVMAALVAVLGQSTDDRFREDVLNGIGEALRGRKQSPKPAGWDHLYPALQQSQSRSVRRRADELALVFQDPRAVARLRVIIGDSDSGQDDRQWALEQLVDHHVPKLSDFFLALLADDRLRLGAIRGLAASGKPAVTTRLLRGYGDWSAVERQAVIAVLASRVDSAGQLVKALRAGQIAAVDVSSFHVRQIRSLGDLQLNKQLDQLWGEVRVSSETKLTRIEHWKRKFDARTLGRADLVAGAQLFKTHCGQCHRLRGVGGEIGPDLTGSNRDNLHYLVENIVDPSAAVANDYCLTTVQTVSGQVLSGIARVAPNGVIRLTTPEREVLISPDDVLATKRLTTSMMPDGLLDNLKADEARDLIAFLMKK